VISDVLRPVKINLTALPGSPEYDAQLSLQRLLPRLRGVLSDLDLPSEAIEGFEDRLATHWPCLFALLRGLYGQC